MLLSDFQCYFHLTFKEALKEACKKPEISTDQFKNSWKEYGIKWPTKKFQSYQRALDKIEELITDSSAPLDSDRLDFFNQKKQSFNEALTILKTSSNIEEIKTVLAQPTLLSKPDRYKIFSTAISNPRPRLTPKSPTLTIEVLRPFFELPLYMATKELGFSKNKLNPFLEKNNIIWPAGLILELKTNIKRINKLLAAGIGTKAEIEWLTEQLNRQTKCLDQALTLPSNQELMVNRLTSTEKETLMAIFNRLPLPPFLGKRLPAQNTEDEPPHKEAKC